MTSVSLSRDTATLVPLQTVPLVVTPRDAQGNALTGRIVTWTWSAPAVAGISQDGTASGVAEGTATISATVEGVVAPVR